MGCSGCVSTHPRRSAKARGVAAFSRPLFSWRRAAELVPWLVLLAFAAVMSQRILPAWNLDVVFYAGASYAQTESDPAEVHRLVYEDIRREAPQQLGELIISESGYRKRVASSAEAFSGQLPFYTAKPLYVSAITVARTLSGGGASAAAFRVSQFAFVLLLVAVSVAARGFASSGVSVAIGVAFGLGIPVVETAELASPDALCAALVIGAFAAFFRGSVWVGGILGVLAVLARPDAVIFVVFGALLPSMVVRPRSEWRVATLAGAGIVVASLLPSLVEGAYGWTMAMRQTFFGSTTYVERLREPLSWADYVYALKKGLGGYMSWNRGGYWPYLAASVVAGVAGLLVRAPREGLWKASLASALCWGAAGIHVFAFPLVADRVLLPAYGMGLLVVAAALAGWRVEKEVDS